MNVFALKTLYAGNKALGQIASNIEIPDWIIKKLKENNIKSSKMIKKVIGDIERIAVDNRIYHITKNKIIKEDPIKFTAEKGINHVLLGKELEDALNSRRGNINGRYSKIS